MCCPKLSCLPELPLSFLDLPCCCSLSAFDCRRYEVASDALALRLLARYDFLHRHLVSELDLLSATGLLNIAHGQVQYSDQSTGLSAAISTTTNGSATDLLLQWRAPATASWAALGIGSGMRGALMFILLPASSGGSGRYTVSVRTAKGHQMPQPLNNVDYSVQTATMQNNQIMASVICRGCTSWSGGTLNTASTQAPWIWAVGPPRGGSSRKRSTVDQGGSFMEHEEQGVSANRPGR